jgi:hypothetical protein
MQKNRIQKLLENSKSRKKNKKTRIWKKKKIQNPENSENLLKNRFQKI